MPVKMVKVIQTAIYMTQLHPLQNVQQRQQAHISHHSTTHYKKDMLKQVNYLSYKNISL